MVYHRTEKGVLNKQYLYKKYFQNPTERRKDCYNKVRNLYTNQTRSAKRNVCFCKFRTFKGNIKRTWININNILQIRKYQKKFSLFKHYNLMLGDSREIADGLKTILKMLVTH